MKKLKLKLMLLCLVVVTSINAQKLSNISKSIKANKDVTIDLKTSYVQIEIDTWNKDVIEIEAYIESDKLSKEELQEALKNWNIEVEGSDNYVKISSKGFHNSWNISRSYINDFGDALRDLELKLAEMPEMPEMPEFPEIPEMSEMPEFPEMPEIPELPELPEGVNTVKFDYDAYKKDGEKYLEKWSKDYEKKYGSAYKEKMKAWGRQFGDSDFQEEMKAWSKNFNKKFDNKWNEKMEVWGEKLGEQFGKEWEEKMEKWEKKMEKWSDQYGKNIEERSKIMEERMRDRRHQIEESRRERKRQIVEGKQERMRELEERKQQRQYAKDGRREALVRRLENRGNNSNVKKIIKIKIPKGAKLKLNVRHGELKFSSVIYNLEADLSHSTLVAKSIDGSDTSIDASYSTILVEYWNDGSLNLNYVDDALLKTVNALILNSNSSNINIDNLNDNAIINGSFGDLVIKNISKSFSNLNIILENSDAFVSLPKTNYNLIFKGSRSRFNDEVTNSKTIKNYPNGNSSSKTIVVNAKYSNVVME